MELSFQSVGQGSAEAESQSFGVWILALSLTSYVTSSKELGRPVPNPDFLFFKNKENTCFDQQLWKAREHAGKSLGQRLAHRLNKLRLCWYISWGLTPDSQLSLLPSITTHFPSHPPVFTLAFFFCRMLYTKKAQSHEEQLLREGGWKLGQGKVNPSFCNPSSPYLDHTFPGRGAPGEALVSRAHGTPITLMQVNRNGELKLLL